MGKGRTCCPILRTCGGSGEEMQAPGYSVAASGNRSKAGSRAISVPSEHATSIVSPPFWGTTAPTFFVVCRRICLLSGPHSAKQAQTQPRRRLLAGVDAVVLCARFSLPCFAYAGGLADLAGRAGLVCADFLHPQCCLFCMPSGQLPASLPACMAAIYGLPASCGRSPSMQAHTPMQK